jgi:hypothetical protein
MPGRLQGGLTSRRAVLWTATILSELPTRISNVSSSVGYDDRSDDAVPGASVAAVPAAGVAARVADAGCLDPMLDRLLAVEVAGLPDEALAADLVGLRVAVSRLEAEFARRLVVFDRRGAAGVTGAVSTAAWLHGACRLSPGEAGERVRTARVLADDLRGGARRSARPRGRRHRAGRAGPAGRTRRCR